MFESAKRLVLDYHHRTSRIPCGERVSRSLARHIGQTESLLDVGCGDGANTQRIQALTGATRVAGVDIELRDQGLIETSLYDGRTLPFDDDSFEAVCLIDMLHHCQEPQRVLEEALRVARRVVAIKDHFKFGPITDAMLYAMDLAGNAKDDIFSPGTYFEPQQWVSMIAQAGGRIEALDWPLKTHDLPWSLIGRPVLQFTAKVSTLRAR